MRIPTPPLGEDTADGKGRGFFTCTTPPAIAASESTEKLLTSKPQSRESSRSEIHRRSLAKRPQEWWEKIPKKPIRRNPYQTAGVVGAFEFDVPEHLPSSPLCPAHRKHTGGGNGVCVYHGRRRGGSMLRAEAGKTENSSESTLGGSYSPKERR